MRDQHILGGLGSSMRVLLITALSVFLMPVNCSTTVDNCENSEHEQLWVGETSTIQYSVEFPNDGKSIPSYSIRYSSKPLPIVTDGIFDRNGLKRSDQSARFSISSSTRTSTQNKVLSVNLTISSICEEDEGKYIFIFTLYTLTSVPPQEYVCKDIAVKPRRAKAICYISSEHSGTVRQLHCHANSGDIQTALSCFQDNQELPRSDEMPQNTKVIFWMNPYAPVHCCSHDVTEKPAQRECTDYHWAPEPPPLITSRLLSRLDNPFLTDIMELPGPDNEMLTIGTSGSLSPNYSQNSITVCLTLIFYAFYRFFS